MIAFLEIVMRYFAAGRVDDANIDIMKKGFLCEL